MNETIMRFLQKQHCATICCIDEQGKPYCFTCFYAFNSEKGLLYFKSSAASHHSILLKINPCIAGTVLPDKLSLVLVKGVQLDGVVLDKKHPFSELSSPIYYKKHPLAFAITGEIYTIQVSHIKMTDSSMGFGKKITWNRGE